jgi:hypothetical protein
MSICRDSLVERSKSLTFSQPHTKYLQSGNYGWGRKGSARDVTDFNPILSFFQKLQPQQRRKLVPPLYSSCGGGGGDPIKKC